MEEYTKICRERLNENESRGPDDGDLPFVRVSKDLKFVEIVICGLGAIYRKKIGSRDPSIVETEVRYHAKNHYQFPG